MTTHPEKFPKLSDDEHFPDVVPGEEEFYGSEIAEESFDVPVIEHALQPEAFAHGGVHRSRGPAARFPPGSHALHLPMLLRGGRLEQQ